MKAKNVQMIICLGIFFLFANQAWAEDWTYYDKAPVGDMYYDKSRIIEVNKGIFSVWTKNILSEKAKTKYYLILKSIDRAPDNPSKLSYYKSLMEIDYINRKIRDVSAIFYDEKDNTIYSSPKNESGTWNTIEPGSVGEKLSNLVSLEPVPPKETVVAAKVEKPAPPKEVAVVAPPIPDKKPTPVKTEQKEAAVATRVEEPVPPKEVAVVAPAVPDKKPTPVKSDQAENRLLGATIGKEIGRDGRFIAFDNQTVLDTRTNLIWAAKDNGQHINWYNAKKYCERYRGGGYTDWRMPTQDELAQLYNAKKAQRNETQQNLLYLTELIDLTACCPWSSETRGPEAAYFDFKDGTRWWSLTPGTSVNQARAPGSNVNRALPVRLAK
ncbi:MAG: Lcl C-terminal domain-containing protein [Smithellaceae bacterium]